jgi:hypothetical protein
LTVFCNSAHFEIANADSGWLSIGPVAKESFMTTNKPTELDGVPEKTKPVGRGHGDHPVHPFDEPIA